VNMNRQFGYVVAKFVSLAKNSGLNATASHPNGKASRMVVASVVFFGQCSLAIIGSANFKSLISAAED
jgi:hypothetical protein